MSDRSITFRFIMVIVLLVVGGIAIAMNGEGMGSIFRILGKIF